MEGIYLYRPNQRVDEDACFKIKYGPREYRVGNFGHVGFIGGEGGAKKSTYVKTICAAALSGEEILFNKVDIGQKKVLYIDTEMPKDLFYAHIEKMFSLSGIPPEQATDQFIGASLVAIPDPIEKKNASFELIDRFKSDLGIVVIDVIADLFEDENETVKVQKFVSDLASLASKYQCMALVVSHINDSGKLLGSIGRKVDRKSSFGIMLEKVNASISTVIPSKTRYEEYPSFDFSLDRDGIPKPGQYIPFPVEIKKNSFR